MSDLLIQALAGLGGIVVGAGVLLLAARQHWWPYNDCQIYGHLWDSGAYDLSTPEGDRWVVECKVCRAVKC